MPGHLPGRPRPREPAESFHQHGGRDPQQRASLLYGHYAERRRHSQSTEAGHRKRFKGSCGQLHRTKELGYRIRETLERGDLDAFGLMLDEHWQNKKRRSSRISDPQIDAWYETAKTNGALGGKVIGAGGGGFLMLYCANGRKAKVRQALSAAGLKEMPYDFDYEGAKVLVNF